jgi:hypothetical protein
VSSSGEQNDDEGDSSGGVSVVLDIVGAKLLVEGGGGPSEGSSSSSSWIPLGVGRLRLLSRGDEAADELTFDSTSSNVSLRHFLFGWSSVGGENRDWATGGGSGDAPSIVSWNAAVALEDPLNAVPEVRNFRLAPNTHEDAKELYQALLSVSSIVIHLILFLKIVHRVYELFHNCNL